MTEKQYRALVGLTYPTDPKVLQRIAKGERVPFELRGERRVQPGEIVSDIPSISVPWLLDQGAIEEVTDG